MRGRTLLVGLLATVALVVAACGSSGSAKAPSGGSGGSPIKIGVMCSCTGSFGITVGAGEKVAQAWAQSVNAAGGLDGHQVQLTLKDDGSNPGTSVTDAQALISSHVDAILDLTILDSAWASAAEAAKIPVIGGNFSADPYFQNPDFYPSGQTNDSIVYANVATAKAAGATNLGQLYCAEAPQCQQSVAPTKAAAQKQGLPVGYNASISATAPNYTAQCLAAKQAGADALFIGDNASIIAKVGQDCDRQGYDPTYIEEGTGFTTQLVSSAGTKDHLYASFPDLPFFSDAAPVQAMNTVVDKYYPGLRNDSTQWSEFAVQAWTAGLLIEDAVKGSNIGTGTPTAAAMTTGLDSISNDTLDGWSPSPLTFTAGKPHPVDCWFTAQVQNGQPGLVNGGKATCQNSSS